MTTNDTARYTVKLGQIVADLLGTSALSVTRLPQSQASCAVGTDSYGTTTLAKVRLERIGAATVRPPDKVRLEADGVAIELNDAGQNGDERAADGVFSGPWNPAAVGRRTLRFSAIGGAYTAGISQDVEAVGRIEFAAAPCIFGALKGRSEGHSSLDLSASRVAGWVDVEIHSSFPAEGVAIELDTGSGWQKLGSGIVSLRVEADASRTWPLRLRVGDCPAAAPASGNRQIELRTVDPHGKTRQFVVPVQIEIVPDPWLHCWWPVVGRRQRVAVFRTRLRTRY
jgi:hypothetical protein